MEAKAGTFQYGSSSGLENDSQWAEERGQWPKLGVEGISFLPFESFDSRTGFPYINTIPSGFYFSHIMCQQLNEFSVNLEGMFGMVCLETDAMRCIHISLWGSLELVKELVLCPPKTETKTPKGWFGRDMPGHVDSNFGSRTFFCTLHFLDGKKRETHTTFLFNLLIQDMGQKQPNPILNFLSSQTQKVLFVRSFPLLHSFSS